MPRGGTFDSDSSNNLVFSGLKTQLSAVVVFFFFWQGFEFKNIV